MHYCSTRHVVKSKGAPSPESSSEMRPTTPSGGGVSPVVRVPPEQPQPFLALPTNPILIVPYSLIQGASLLPAPAAGLHPPDTAYFLLQDGTLQPMATAITSRPLSEKPLRPVPPFHSPPQVSIVLRGYCTLLSIANNIMRFRRQGEYDVTYLHRKQRRRFADNSDEPSKPNKVLKPMQFHYLVIFQGF